jgi:leucyl-tRNA synthetase
MKRYDHTKIEKKWQKDWAKKGLYKTKDKVPGAKNHYLLTEFPYPSGNLHVGHWYAFAVPDIAARALRMQGKNVLYPAGFDAFGLPAENAAIKRGLDPRKWTLANIAYMKKQMASMGASFDWSREVQTIDPAYYRWTQWMFTQFLKKGLAYRKETPVNWCPKDKTVLANEQVVGGLCERCETPVEQRTMLQWNLRITDYADRLVDDLDALDWPQQIKDSQKNWIGRSEGAEIDFKLAGTDTAITVFTTRPDTLFGATYLVLAPEHPMVAKLSDITNAKEVEEYIAATKRKSDLERQEGKEKTGVKLEGVDAINPATGEKIPVYIADYVLAHYGTGAIMAVPAHDERDFEFAQKFALPIRQVVSGGEIVEKAYTGDGTIMGSGPYDGLTISDAKQKMTTAFGTPKKTYRLRDWIVSRQRYWGVPIPVIHCANCGAVPVPDKDLPVKLPVIKDYLPTGDGKSPLAKAAKWKQVKCPQCKAWAERETDTLDTFVDSSWYFLRYTDPKNTKQFADKKKMKEWMPVDLYSGGAEHTTMPRQCSRYRMRRDYCLPCLYLINQKCKMNCLIFLRHFYYPQQLETILC